MKAVGKKKTFQQLFHKNKIPVLTVIAYDTIWCGF